MMQYQLLFERKPEIGLYSFVWNQVEKYLGKIKTRPSGRAENNDCNDVTKSKTCSYYFFEK